MKEQTNNKPNTPYIGNIIDKYASGYSLDKRTVLVVDDSDISREILCEILGDTYNILTAVNGREALEIVRANVKQISLILLDLVMPEMDGWAFLTEMQKNPTLAAIPVIVTTSLDGIDDEICCLEKGATDFVTKPYNPDIIRGRAARIIRLRESSALLTSLERDELTGLYNKDFFYLNVDLILSKNTDKIYDLIICDVEDFKMINDRLGVKTGDDFLIYLANRYHAAVGSNGILGRLYGAIFAILIERGDGSLRDKVLLQISPQEDHAPVKNITIKYGIYENATTELNATGMCDRAILALNRIKHKYAKNVAVFDQKMHAAMLREQQMIFAMQESLANRHFKVYYQPKHNIATGKIAGAEALVRWIHPEYGFLSPGEFIPLFEQNGFITELDNFVWTDVVDNIRNWTDRGMPVVPISINISRVDFQIPDLAEKIIRLADSRQIDHNLLHLEVTESAFTSDEQKIIPVVDKLRANGFKVEIDDFGSGYSSLNMIGEFNFDILKLDMQFMRNETPRKETVIRFIIKLSQWLKAKTVAEGVETAEQLAILKEFGCDYAQGYFFAKPMPLDEFEEYMVAHSAI